MQINSRDALTSAQVKQILKIKHDSETRAVPVVAQLGTIVQRIDENLLTDREDAALGRKLTREMNALAVQLLEMQRQAHRQMVRLLTPGQRKLVRTEVRKPDSSGKLSDVILSVFHVSDAPR